MLPYADVAAMTIHLAESSHRVTEGAHAVLVPDGAGWHTSPKPCVPGSITLLPLPRHAPELNPVEDLGEFLRQDLLSHRAWDNCDAIADACCHAWTTLRHMPQQVTSTTTHLGTGQGLGQLASLVQNAKPRFR